MAYPIPGKLPWISRGQCNRRGIPGHEHWTPVSSALHHNINFDFFFSDIMYFDFPLATTATYPALHTDVTLELRLLIWRKCHLVFQVQLVFLVAEIEDQFTHKLATSLALPITFDFRILLLHIEYPETLIQYDRPQPDLKMTNEALVAFA